MSHSSKRTPFEETGSQPLDDDFDELVLSAVRGSRHAIAALSIGYGPVLVRQARAMLGQIGAHETASVVSDLFCAMLRGSLEFQPGRDRGRKWLRQQLRELAARRRAERRPN